MKPIGLKVSNNEAFINNHSFYDLKETFKTPLYVFDEVMLKKNLNDYFTYFKSDLFKTQVVYASKAFLTYEFAKYLNNYPIFMDAVSLGDMYICVKAGFGLEKVVLHGNNKSNEELEFAVKNNIGLIVVDNLYELNKLNEITLALNKKVDILFRINPYIDAHTHKYIQTSKINSKFGESILDKETINLLINTAISSKNINLKGVHAHIGSQIHEVEAFKLEIRKLVAFINELNNNFNLSLNTLNLGGGFGIKYTIDEQDVSIKDMQQGIIQELEKEIKNSDSKINYVLIEPGRSIIGSCGMTLYSISQIKKTFGAKNYLFIDGGMADNIRPALYDAVYEVDVVKKMNNKKDILVDVVGKCCESGDIIRTDVLVPMVDDSDLLLVYQTGAYNYSMSMNYNGLLKPACVLVGEDVKVLSPRQTLDDLIK